MDQDPTELKHFEKEEATFKLVHWFRQSWALFWTFPENASNVLDLHSAPMQFLLDADKAWLLLKLTFLSENQRWFFGLADLMSLCGENSVKEKGPFEAKMQTPFPNYSQWYCVKSYLSTLCRIFSKIQPERHPITPNHPYIYIYMYIMCSA